MKQKCRWMLLLVVVCLSMGLTGCQSVKGFISHNKTDDQSTSAGIGYNIYYMNMEETKLMAVGYQFVSTTEDGIIQECLNALKADPEDKGYKPVLTAPVNVERYTYDKEQAALGLYFDAQYQELSETTEMLVRTAIVKTMTQFGGIIDSVTFNIDGEWVKDADGNILKMRDTDYAVDIESK